MWDALYGRSVGCVGRRGDCGLFAFCGLYGGFELHLQSREFFDSRGMWPAVILRCATDRDGLRMDEVVSG